MTGVLPEQQGLRLTPRQEQCLKLVADGQTFKVVANVLGLRPSTVDKHLDLMKRRLGARTLAHAVALGFREGYLR